MTVLTQSWVFVMNLGLASHVYRHFIDFMETLLSFTFTATTARIFEDLG